MKIDNKYLIAGIIIVLAAVGLYFVPLHVQAPQQPATDFESCVSQGGTVTGNTCTVPSGSCCFQQPPQASSEASIANPQPNTVVTSPLTVTGQALGTWYFEATLPVVLRDADGNILDQEPGQALSDWMTTSPVPFAATLNFTQPATQTGTIEIHNDNPSGDPVNDKVFSVPVKFW